MNNKRRKKIKKIIEMFYDINDIIKANKNDNSVEKLIECCYLDLLFIQNEEQDAFDNLSEGLQCSRRGEAIEKNAELLENCIDMIEDIEDENNLNEIVDTIDFVIDQLNDII